MIHQPRRTPTTALLLCLFLVVFVASTSWAHDPSLGRFDWYAAAPGPLWFPYDKKHDEVAERVKQYVEDGVPLVDDDGHPYYWDQMTVDVGEPQDGYSGLILHNGLVRVFELEDLRRRARETLREYPQTEEIRQALQKPGYDNTIDGVVDVLLFEARGLEHRVGPRDSQSEWPAALHHLFDLNVRYRYNDDVYHRFHALVKEIEVALFEYFRLTQLIWETTSAAAWVDSEVHRTAQCPTVEQPGAKVYWVEAKREFDADPNMLSLVRLVAPASLRGRRPDSELVSIFSRILLDTAATFEIQHLEIDEWSAGLCAALERWIRADVHPEDIRFDERDPAQQLLKGMEGKLQQFGREYVQVRRTAPFVYHKGNFRS